MRTTSARNDVRLDFSDKAVFVFPICNCLDCAHFLSYIGAAPRVFYRWASFSPSKDDKIVRFNFKKTRGRNGAKMVTRRGAPAQALWRRRG
jgi:hypothetical protein